MEGESIKPQWLAFSSKKKQATRLAGPRDFNASTPIVHLSNPGLAHQTELPLLTKEKAIEPNAVVITSRPVLDELSANDSDVYAAAADKLAHAVTSTITPSRSLPLVPPPIQPRDSSREAQAERERERARTHSQRTAARRHFLYPPIDARAPLLSLEELRFRQHFATTTTGSDSAPRATAPASSGAGVSKKNTSVLTAQNRATSPIVTARTNAREASSGGGIAKPLLPAATSLTRPSLPPRTSSLATRKAPPTPPSPNTRPAPALSLGKKGSRTEVPRAYPDPNTAAAQGLGLPSPPPTPSPSSSPSPAAVSLPRERTGGVFPASQIETDCDSSVAAEKSNTMLPPININIDSNTATLPSPPNNPEVKPRPSNIDNMKSGLKGFIDTSITHIEVVDDRSPEEESTEASAPIPFPLHRPRVPSRPLPSIPSSSSIAFISSTSPPPPATNTNSEQTLKPQSSFQLLTPTPTTPRVVERTWTRKVSLWPPPLGAESDVFAREIPVRASVLPARVSMLRHSSSETEEDELVDEEERKVSVEGEVGDVVRFLRDDATAEAADMDRDALGRPSTSTRYTTSEDSHHSAPHPSYDAPSPIAERVPSPFLDPAEWSEIEAPSTPVLADLNSNARPVFKRGHSHGSSRTSIGERFMKVVGRRRSGSVDMLVLGSEKDEFESPIRPSAVRSSTASSGASVYSTASKKERPRLTLVVPTPPSPDGPLSPKSMYQQGMLLASPPPIPTRSPARSTTKAASSSSGSDNLTPASEETPKKALKPGEAVREAIKARNERARQRMEQSLPRPPSQPLPMPLSTPLSFSHSVGTTGTAATAASPNVTFGYGFDDGESINDHDEDEQSVYTRATSFASSSFASHHGRRPSEGGMSLKLSRTRSSGGSKRRRGSNASGLMREEQNELETAPDVPTIPAGLLLALEGTEDVPQSTFDEGDIPTPRPWTAAPSGWPSDSPSHAVGDRPKAEEFEPDVYEQFVRELEQRTKRVSLDLTLSLPSSPASPPPSWPRNSENELSFGEYAFDSIPSRSLPSVPVVASPPSFKVVPMIDVTSPVVDQRNSEDERVRARVVSEAALHPSPYAADFTDTHSSISTKVGSASSHTIKSKKSSLSLSTKLSVGGGSQKLAKAPRRPSAKEKAKALSKYEAEAFTESSSLGTSDVYRAAQLPVLSTSGEPVRFGTLFEDGTSPTIVLFLRHFFCPLCQDYMRSIVDNAPKELLDREGIRLVIIGCGSPALAKAYNENVFHSPFEIYVDPTRALYRALGMTRLSLDPGSAEQKGAYVTHGPLTGLGVVLRNALKMPIGKAGNIKQLGGEFVLGPGMRAEYCHRMPTTAGHEEVRTLLERAGVKFDGWKSETLPGGGTRLVKDDAFSASSLGHKSPRSFVASSLSSRPPRLDVLVEDEEVKGQKNAWDEFIRWTTRRKDRLSRHIPSSDHDGNENENDEEPYPWAFADRDLWSEHGGFCAHDGDDDGATDCASSIMGHSASLDARMGISWRAPSPRVGAAF